MEQKKKIAAIAVPIARGLHQSGQDNKHDEKDDKNSKSEQLRALSEETFAP
jgi:hypothetical protein